MKSTTRFLALTAAALLLSGADLFAQNTATVNVSAVVAASAKLTINNAAAANVSFPDADPDLTPVISQAEPALDIAAKAKTSGAGVVTLTVVADGPLTAAGGATIPANAINWTVTGGGFSAGTMSTTAVTLGTWAGPGNRSGTQTYRLANSWSYVTGNYAMTVTYTLTIP
jgi:hypothetical protein